MLFLPFTASAAPSRDVISFSARLKKATGGIVADGYYNISFSLYDQATGGTALWTESYHDINGAAAGQDNRVRVANGYLTVKLGELNPFGTNIDWADSLWLTMNIGGTAQVTAANITWDGEMSPRIQLSAVPYAMNASLLDGKSADEFFQLGTGGQTDSSDAPSIAINKTGSGDFVKLQASGEDAFSLHNNGSITLGSVSNQSIQVAQSTSGSGKQLTLAGGGAATGSDQAGGDLVLQGGAGDGTGGSGSVVVKSADSNSASAFDVQNTAGISVFTVDTDTRAISTGTITVKSAHTTQYDSEIGLWDNATPTGGFAEQFGSAINLGTVFKSSKPGVVTGVRFYNPANGNASGTDVGKLWSCSTATCDILESGTELASVTFAADSSPGWKSAYFSSPVTITPNTYYVVTHYSPSGHYYGSADYFEENPRRNGPLTAPANDTTVNGRFSIGTAGFPNTSLEATNYWTDIIFQEDITSDKITSGGNLSIGSDGAMTIGPDGHSLSMQGSDIDITADDSVTVGGDKFSVQDSTGNQMLGIDSATQQITLGKSDTTATTLVLDTKTNAGDPAGTNGAMYYNSAAGKFRCFEGGAWLDCITPLPVSLTLDNGFSALTGPDDPIDVDGASFELAPNTKYHYKFNIMHNAPYDGSTASFGVTLPSGTVSNTYCVTTHSLTDENVGMVGANPDAYCGVGDASTDMSTQSVNLDGNYISFLEGYIETGNNAGDLQLRMQTFGFSEIELNDKTFGILQIVQ